MIAANRSVAVVALAVALGIPMALRLRLPSVAPALAVALIAGLTLTNGLQTPLAAAVTMVATVGTTAAVMPPARSAPVLGVLVGVVAVMIGIDGAPLDVAFASFLYGGAWLVGIELHRRRAQSQAMQQRATQAIAVLEAEIAAARTQERLRIARELHDVVAHSLSVVTLHTQAVRRRLVEDDRQRDREALAAVEDAARSALVELRRLFGLLRADEPAPLEPQPGHRQVSGLAAALEASGVRVVLRMPDELEIPPGIDLAVYRLIQEATTNVMKHAGASQVEIAVTREQHAVRVVVNDDGHGVPVLPGPPMTGHGLLGMRERVAAYGGTLSARAHPDGGFRVDALLPLEGTR